MTEYALMKYFQKCPGTCKERPSFSQEEGVLLSRKELISTLKRLKWYKCKDKSKAEGIVWVCVRLFSNMSLCFHNTLTRESTYSKNT